MFGYVRPFKPYMRMFEYDIYKAVYCGLCKDMGRRYGFVTRFTLSYDFAFLSLMDLSVRGVKLDAEKQRCIARVMLSLPPMLILDEATSSIDTRTEILVQRAFEKMMQGRTSFIIAHRLSTIKNADTIIVMDSGHIVEQGSHDELMAKNGFYADLYNSQFAVT